MRRMHTHRIYTSLPEEVSQEDRDKFECVIKIDPHGSATLNPAFTAAIDAALPEHPPSHTEEGRLSVRRATRIQRRMSALSCLGLGMVSCLPLYSLRARERECPWGCRHGDFGRPCVGAGRGQRLVDGGLSCGEQPRVPWHHTPW